MHRLPLRQREVGELNALTRIIGVAANAKSKIHRVASYRMRTIDHSDKVLSSPQPPPLLPWFLRARHPLYSIGPRPLAATFLPIPREMLALHLSSHNGETNPSRLVHMYEQSYGYVADATCQICRFAFQNGTTPEAVANNDNVRPSSDYLRHLNRMPLLLRLSKRYTDQNNNSTRVNFILR